MFRLSDPAENDPDGYQILESHIGVYGFGEGVEHDDDYPRWWECDPATDCWRYNLVGAMDSYGAVENGFDSAAWLAWDGCATPPRCQLPKVNVEFGQATGDVHEVPPLWCVMTPSVEALVGIWPRPVCTASKC